MCHLTRYLNIRGYNVVDNGSVRERIMLLKWKKN